MTSRAFAAAMVALFAAVALLFSAMPETMAQQVTPTASSVQEDELLRALQTGENVSGRVSIPDRQAGELIKPDNKGWADLSQGTLQTFAVGILVVALIGLALFYFIRGRIALEGGFSGRSILRFGWFERLAHWMLASTFIVLALTGLNLVIGRAVILPIVGESAFGTLSAWGKIAHNYLAWPFMISLAIVFVLWIVHNIPGRIDLEWIKQGGGFLKKGVHPPAKKFNAGQKIVFWCVVLGGAAMSYTGVMLLFPHLAGTAADWQFYQVVHAIVAGLLSAVILGHIYIGTLGMEGAFDAMGKGEVDENWAEQHHSLWAREVKSAAVSTAKSDEAIAPAE
jgi:formate dehydrogenase subunit gamma